MSQHREEQNTHEDAVAKLGELIHDISIAMLTTLEEDGKLRSRPMATQQEKFDGQLWFFTKSNSGKADEIRHDHRVNLAYSLPEKNRYVSATGTAALVYDKDKMKQFWSPAYKAWFPEGLDDPEIVLLRVDVESAEYWESPSSAVVKIVGFVKAIATGKEYNPGENKVLDLEKV